MKRVRRIRKKRDKKISYRSLWIILLLGFIWISFNKSGAIKWASLYYKKKNIEKQIDLLKIQKQNITEHNKILENDMEYIQFLAYSKYKMVKPGEKIFRIKDSKNIIKKETRK